MRVPALCALWLACAVTPASAQTPPSTPPTDAPPVRASTSTAERELNLIALPTSQSLKRYGTYFRLTHRFTRDLRFGTFGDLLGDLFGLDAGSIIGLEFRFAPASNLQVALHRTNLFKDIQLSGRFDAFREETHRVSVSLVGSIEGDNNFQDHHQPATALVFSRSLGGGFAVLYASPTVAWNTPTLQTGHEGHDPEHDEGTVAPAPVGGSDDYTAYVGLGGRVRLRPSVFVTAEYSPRVSGYRPDRGAWGVAIEKHTRGHMFQINVTNTFATTFAQIARGGDRHNVYLGFNLARRF